MVSGLPMTWSLATRRRDFANGPVKGSPDRAPSSTPPLPSLYSYGQPNRVWSSTTANHCHYSNAGGREWAVRAGRARLFLLQHVFRVDGRRPPPSRAHVPELQCRSPHLGSAVVQVHPMQAALGLSL